MKKGFTLVEIIISISLIVIIGVSSFVGINYVKSKVKHDKLVQIEDKIYEAANVYIESNKEASNKLYNEKNGVYIPLSVLEDEGLIEFTDINITKDDYVLTLLGGFGASSACIDTTQIGSWDDSDRVIYLCADTSSSGGNLTAISPNEINNFYSVSKEVNYYVGSGVDNYIKYGDKTYRILYVDIDDSLVLYNGASFGSAFSDNQLMDIYGIDTLKCNDSSYSPQYECSDFTDKSICSIKCVWSWGSSKSVEAALITYKTVKDEVIISGIDYENSRICYSKNISSSGTTTYYAAAPPPASDVHTVTIVVPNFSSSTNYTCSTFVGSVPKSNYKIHLDPCMKITGGTGDVANPFILTDTGC